ncbi:MAG: ABC-2 family transporter protein [bacterium]|nr:ABC-2 family transporter protein [bacterium]
MKVYLEKWWMTMRVSWSNLLVYRVNFILQGIAPLFVFLVVKLSLWYKIFESSPQAQVGGYHFEEMAAYHLWILIASLLIFNGNSQRISEDIRLGRITSYLIYPFQLWEFHAASFLARSWFQLFIALGTLFGAWALLGGRLALPSPAALLAGLGLALLGGLFWFWVNFMVGLVGFWLEETWTLMVMLQIVTYFLSGAIIPLELYPDWMQTLLSFTPFPYIAYWPARLFMGHLDQVGWVFGALAFWVVVMALAAWWTWRAGMRLYTAAGM